MRDQPVKSSLNAPLDTPYVQEACNNRPHHKITNTLRFPKPSMTCEWDKDGNLSPKDQFFQGRIEQMQKLDLPVQSIICDVKFNFTKQQFRYDDHFLLTFNDAIIASSYNFGGKFDEKYGLLRYDWSRMAGMHWDNTQEGDFCAPGGNCSWPATDTPGFISLEYEAYVFQKLMAEDINRNQHVLRFVSIGDNDDKDCEHSDVNFSIDVDYVTAQ